jgi:hypothetical protein
MSDKPASNPNTASDLEKAIKAVAEQMIPAAIAAAITATQGTRPAAQAAPVQPNGSNPQCSECGQKRSACGGKHVQMVVFPTRFPQFADYFPGVILNGVKYLSNDDSHTVTVPAIAESDVLNTVAGFERNEHEMANGRVAERHSGTVSPRGTSFSPANAAWR